MTSEGCDRFAFRHQVHKLKRHKGAVVGELRDGEELLYHVGEEVLILQVAQSGALREQDGCHIQLDQEVLVTRCRHHRNQGTHINIHQAIQEFILGVDEGQQLTNDEEVHQVGCGCVDGSLEWLDDELRHDFGHQQGTVVWVVVLLLDEELPDELA